MNIQARQGDVFFQQIETLPDGLEKQKGLILVYGESTGHAHRAEKGEVYLGENGSMFLKVTKPTRIVHEEHGPIHLSAGLWAVIRQREYQSKDMVRLVVD